MIPMMPETRQKIALSIYLAVEGLCTAPTDALGDEVCKHMAIITAAVDYVAGAENYWQSSSGSTLRTAADILETALARCDAGAHWYVTEEEAATLRSAAAQFDHVLRLIPFNVYRAAQVYVERALS